MSDHEIKAVVERLQEYDNKISEIYDLVGGKSRLVGAEKALAREALRSLKASLANECKTLYRGRHQLNHYESTYLEPAVSRAAARLTTRVNSNPGSEWHSSLYEARIEFTHMLFQLESVETE